MNRQCADVCMYRFIYRSHRVHIAYIAYLTVKVLQTETDNGRNFAKMLLPPSLPPSLPATPSEVAARDTRNVRISAAASGTARTAE